MFRKLILALGSFTALAAIGNSQTYYSIDVTNDVLYTINVNTGLATMVGSLGSDLDGVDMTWNQGALYAKSFGTSNGSRIYQLVTNGAFAGFAIPGAQLNGGGYQGAEAAGLAGNGAGLYLTYSNQVPIDYYSQQFGRVDPVTGLITYLSSQSTDADAMGFTGGQFWTVDIINPSAGYDIYRGATSPTTFVGNDTYDVTLDTNPVDLEYYSPTELVSVSQTGRKLVRVNRFTGLRGTVTPIAGIPANGFMKGLARVRNPCQSSQTFYE